MILLMFWAVMGLVGFVLGNTKGRGLFGFCLGALLGPIGWILVLCFSNTDAECPFCKKAVDERATICAYCRSSIAPELPAVHLQPSEDAYEKWQSQRKTIEPSKPVA